MQQAEPSRTVMCDACADGHWEEPIVVGEPRSAPARAYIVCPEAGRVEVDLERRTRWRVHLHALAALVSRGLATTEEPREFVTDRLWSIGRCPKLGGGHRRVYLVRGLMWPDADRTFLPHLRPDRRPSAGLISLVTVPASGLAYGIPVCSLADFLSIQKMELVLSSPAITATFDAMLKDGQFVFVREGDYWTITFEGKGLHLRDTKGLRFVSYLLHHPGKAVRALDLVRAVEGQSPDTVARSEEGLGRLVAVVDQGKAAVIWIGREST